MKELMFVSLTNTNNDSIDFKCAYVVDRYLAEENKFTLEVTIIDNEHTKEEIEELLAPFVNNLYEFKLYGRVYDENYKNYIYNLSKYIKYKSGHIESVEDFIAEIQSDKKYFIITIMEKG